MIYFYSGTPGSGKTLQTVQEIELWLKKLKKNVIANFHVDRDFILLGKPGGRFYYCSNENLTPDFLYKYAIKFHSLGIEHQSLLVIDEAQVKFSPTAVKLGTQIDKRYRQDWLEFFSQHRHLGYDIIIISQFDKLIDAQIRCLFEYNYIHRNATNFKMIGKLMTIFRVNLFVQVQYWYGCNEQTGHKFFFYKKRYSKMYNSYAYRDIIVAKLVKKFGSDFMDKLLNKHQMVNTVK